MRRVFRRSAPHASHARAVFSSDLQVRRLTAVVSCIREISSASDDDSTVVDGVSTVFNITQVSDLRFLWFVLSARVYEFLTAFNISEHVLRVVDGTREDYEIKYSLLFLHEKVVSPGSRRTSRSSLCSGILVIVGCSHALAGWLKWQG